MAAFSTLRKLVLRMNVQSELTIQSKLKVYFQSRNVRIGPKELVPERASTRACGEKGTG